MWSFTHAYWSVFTQWPNIINVHCSRSYHYDRCKVLCNSYMCQNLSVRVLHWRRIRERENGWGGLERKHKWRRAIIGIWRKRRKSFGSKKMMREVQKKEKRRGAIMTNKTAISSSKVERERKESNDKKTERRNVSCIIQKGHGLPRKKERRKRRRRSEERERGQYI